MIGTQPTGAIQGVVIQAVAHEGLTVTVDGRPGRLAVLDEAGNVISSGLLVAREAEAVAVNNHRNFLMGKGHLRVLSNPISTSARPA